MIRKAIIAGAALLALAACATKNQENKFFDQVSKLTKEQVLEKGDELVAKKKWEEARKYYSFLADTFPNDPLGRQASLRVADTFFKAKDVESITEAQLRYKDFANRFPNDPNRAYALMMLGRCSFQQKRGPQRDLAPIKEASESFRKVVELYPDSSYAKEAQDLYAQCQEDLAQHELEVAYYYWRVGAWMGAKQRLDYLFAAYPKSVAVARAGSLVEQVEKKLAATTDSAPRGAAKPKPAEPRSH